MIFSKRRKLDNQQTSETMSPFSVHAALSSDDLLCDIFLQLPPESVFNLALVSKRWLQVICGPQFRHSYFSKWRAKSYLVGFFISNSLYLGKRRDRVRRPRTEPVLPLLSTTKEGDDLEFSGILNKMGYFIGSSNDFLLCGRHPKTYTFWDPISRKQHQLPHPRVHFEELCMAFIVEDCPDDGVSYQVIRAKCENRLDEVKTVCIETYSSKTTTWSFSILSCPVPLSLSPWTSGTVIKGKVYWHATSGKVAVYDPDDEEKRIELIKLPGSFDYDEQDFGESSDGCLQYGQSNKSGMKIWVLKKDELELAEPSTPSKWSLKYKINFKSMWRKNPSLSTRFTPRNKETQLLSFLYQSSDSVFIRCDSNIFVYNLESGSLEEVQYQGRSSSIMWDFCKVVPYFRRAWPRSSLCDGRMCI